jgi:hypothetical protein
MSSVTNSGYAGRLIDKIGTAMQVISRILEKLMTMALPKRSDSLASYRSRSAHGETYQLKKDEAQALFRKLKEDKRRRAEKKRLLEDAH